MYLLFNILSRFLIDFLPKRKHLSISWLQSWSAVILESKKIKSVTASNFSPFYLPSTDGTKCHDLSFLNAEFQANFFTLLFHLHQATLLGFPGSSAGKESACQCRRHNRHRFDSWVGKISWRRAWQPTPVFLPGESHGQRSLVACGPQDHRVAHNWSVLAVKILSSIILPKHTQVPLPSQLFPLTLGAFYLFSMLIFCLFQNASQMES